MKDRRMAGHGSALLTAIMWGTTFVSTKLLLADFTPVEILFLRFITGLAVLTALSPRRIKGTTARQELVFAAAGLCGLTMYQLIENIALTCTMASNVSVIVSAAPFFTALLSHFLTREEKLRPSFLAGFAVAVTGICLISFNGARLELNPLGDLLALLAAFIWACYSLLVKKIGSFGCGTIQATRHIFFYGVLFMLPVLAVAGFSPEPARLAAPINLANLLYLGLGASALCFVTWNRAVNILGAVRTSVYIYIVPVITVAVSAVVLKERLTVLSAAGTALTLAGLALSQRPGAPRGKPPALEKRDGGV